MQGLLKRFGRTVSTALNGHPAIRSAKNLRNRIVDHTFRRRRCAAGREFADRLARRGARQVCVSVAFNSPWVIDLLTAAWSRYPPGMTLAVVDNSGDASARGQHAGICGRRDVPYLALPPNPEWNPNRSHGIALNWVWYNVIRHFDPEIVGFIDHDCFPIRGYDVPARMTGLTVYGLRSVSRTHPPAWNMWAGYCFLRPQPLRERDVDFKHRVEYGLDTGGGNWLTVYRHLAPSTVGDAVPGRVPIDVGEGAPAVELQVLDEAFVHLGGASYTEQFRDSRFRRRLLDAIRERWLGGIPGLVDDR